MTTLTDQQISSEQLTEARKNLETAQEGYIAFLEKHGDPKDLEAARAAAPAAYGASGTFNVAAVGIWARVTCELTYTDSGKKLRFDGTAWGIGAGDAYAPIGGGPFVAPEVLIGDAKFHVQFAAGGGGVVNATWWTPGGAVGQYTGVALGGGAGEMGGSGTWSWA